MRDLGYTISSTLFLTVLLLFITGVGLAEVRSSSNYQIQSDSLNVGGGYGSSDGYQLESTAGEIATGLSGSASYSLRAGYQQMQASYIALSSSGDLNLSPALQGVTGGYASGTVTTNVITDGTGGYTLTIQFENDPAMQSATDNIPDLVTDTTDPDFNFSVGPSEAFFGFSPEGSHIVSRYLDSGGICNQPAGSDTPDRCWESPSTTPITIASSNSSNHPLGTETDIVFQVGIGGSVSQTVGTYVATTTITATAL